jgi:hypothetical protein
VSNELKRFCFNLGIKLVITSLYYPQPSDAEHFNYNHQSALIAYCADSQTSWDENVPWL